MKSPVLTVTAVAQQLRGYDLDLSGLVALGEGMVASQTLTSVDFSDCHMGPAAVTELSKSIPSMAALTEVDVHSNKELDEVAVAALRAAAPETCKILADY